LHQHALDEAVDVFIVSVDESRVGLAALPDVCQGLLDLIDVGFREHAGAPERARPRQAPGDVFVEQPPIEAKRLLKFEGRGVGRGLKSSGPECAHDTTNALRDSSARRSASANGDLRPTMWQAPLNSFMRICPVTRSWTALMYASSASRNG